MITNSNRADFEKFPFGDYRKKSVNSKTVYQRLWAKQIPTFKVGTFYGG